MQCACAKLKSVACPALLYVSTLYHKQHDKKREREREREREDIERKICVLISSTTFVQNISHYKKTWVRYEQKYHWPSCKVPVILVCFLWNLNFLDIFQKNTQISNLMKIHLVGAKLFRADGQADVMKLIVAFYNFANTPKKSHLRFF